jgi:2-iminobutanoate/2-iminopropanoate deaminase
MGQVAERNAVYAEFFTSDFPSRSAVQVAALPKGAIVEIEAIAVMPHEHEDECCKHK